MQRVLSLALGVGALVIAIWLTVQSVGRWHPERLGLAGDAGREGAASDAAPQDLTLDAALDPGFDLPSLGGPEVHRADGGVGSRMPDGSPVPSLPPDVPKQVRFGVVLVAYRGAEGASPTARTKSDAESLAAELAEVAKTDFHAASRRGDDGSADDLGHMQQGVLELAPEYILFTLPKGGVSGPIDTPRGYWIARRIE